MLAALQAVTTTPLIAAAERLETPHEHASAAASEAQHDEATPAPAARALTTLIATTGIAVGYAWILLALMHVAGRPISARSIVPWAVAGFLATGLAPSFGLAPALPGAAESDLAARQLWWIGTAAATGAGLAALALGRGKLMALLGLALILLPHLVGAPIAAAPVSRVPAEIAAAFAASSLGLQFLAWTVPAVIAGYAVARLEPAAP